MDLIHPPSEIFTYSIELHARNMRPENEDEGDLALGLIVKSTT